MAERRLPELFIGGDITMHPLHYNLDERTFVIGGKTIPLDSSDLVRETYDPSGEEVAGEALLATAVGIGIWGNPLTTPKFYDWLQEGCTQNDLENARVAMHGVFEVRRGMKVKRELGTNDSLWGFSAGFLRPGHLNLSTIGNCACLGVKVDGHIVDSDEWDTGFAEYEFHNTDYDFQRISLMAGLGHLARLAS